MTAPAPDYPRLAAFTLAGYDKGRGVLWQAAWFAVQSAVFSAWWFPRRLRPAVLRAFGATVGENVTIRHRVRVLWPWKLEIGQDTWIGEDAWLLNLEPIAIGADVCVSQGVFVCTGSHDRRSPDFRYDNGPIVVEDGVWLAAQSLVLRGVTVGRGSVLAARAVATRDVPPGTTVRVGEVF
jgi:putative colanic acid biosynthesis acetyltransferase WcaF